MGLSGFFRKPFFDELSIKVLLFIILSLGVPELTVLAACVRRQSVMGSLLYVLPVVKHGDGITEPAA